MQDFDVIIIGGGPAGSSMASYLSINKVRCAVFEREKFPRPHVGESLVPSSTRVFEEIGFLDKMNQSDFPRKYGAAWTTFSNKQTFSHDWSALHEGNAEIKFDEKAQQGIHQDFTFHVDRSIFDQMLLDHARAKGAQVFEEHDVSHVEFKGKDKVEVTVRDRDGKSSLLTCKILVDASGRRTFLGNKLKLKVKDPVFNQCAYHTWYKHYDRSAWQHPDYIYIHFIPLSNSWIWQIPITEDVTSIGVVTQKENFPSSEDQRKQFFMECIATRPEMLRELKKAEQVTPFRVEADYSYSMTRLTGDNFLLVGDAARFVDPIFSSGVSVALNSSRFAHKDILRALEKGDYSQKSFENYRTKLACGVNNWYRFIGMYYRLNVLFTYFVNNPKYRLQVLQFLQGDVYDESSPELLDEMAKMIEVVENNPKHPLHSYLGSLTGKSKPGHSSFAPY